MGQPKNRRISVYSLSCLPACRVLKLQCVSLFFMAWYCCASSSSSFLFFRYKAHLDTHFYLLISACSFLQILASPYKYLFSGFSVLDEVACRSCICQGGWSSDETPATNGRTRSGKTRYSVHLTSSALEIAWDVDPTPPGFFLQTRNGVAYDAFSLAHI